MKKAIFIIFAYLCCPCISFAEMPADTINIENKDFIKNYRHYPFQWIYPEYYYKADIIPVKKEIKTLKGYSKINFFGLSAFIPKKYTHEIKRNDDIKYFKSKDKKLITMIKSSDSSALCTDLNKSYMKDYCSSFKTPQEYNHKLFTLTPDKAETAGDKWIVHDKGAVFENTKRVEIFSDDMFMAYVRVIKDSLVKEKKVKFSHEIVLFHKNGPLNSFITIAFKNENDATIRHFISTIK